MMTTYIKQEPVDHDEELMTKECSENVSIGRFDDNFNTETLGENFSTTNNDDSMVIKKEYTGTSDIINNERNSETDNVIEATELTTRSRFSAGESEYTITVDRRKGQPRKCRSHVSYKEENVDDLDDRFLNDNAIEEKQSHNRRKKNKTQKHVSLYIVNKFSDDNCENNEILHYDSDTNSYDEKFTQTMDEDDELSENLNNEELDENIHTDKENGSEKEMTAANIDENLVRDMLTKICAATEKTTMPKKKAKGKGIGNKIDTNVVKEFPCSVCGKMFYKKKNLTLHFKIHIGLKNYVCSYCGKKFLTSKCMRRHERIHTGERPYKCDICGNGFICWSAKNVHMRVHTGIKPYQCEYCGKEFASKSGLNSHVANHHTGDKPFHCEKCDKSFPLQRDLNVHIKTHSELRPHVCETCGQGFKRLSSLTEHKYRHSGEKPHMCELCGKGFYNRYKLNKHMLKHTGPGTMFRCCECNKLFSDAESLKEHKNDHAEEQVACSICGKLTANQRCLKKHMRLHTGEKPYDCDVCGRLFSQLNNLKRHKLCHTGEKPYECSTCNRRFTQSSTLKAHIRLHTGERPFVCSICGKGFAQQTNLKTHEKKHGGKNVTCNICGKYFPKMSALRKHVKEHKTETSMSYDDMENNWFKLQAAMLNNSETSAGSPVVENPGIEQSVKSLETALN